MRIITGCSRSGTSFVCQAVQELGGDFGNGEQLIDADRWNKRGYFENRAVNTLNHRLLFGRWSNPRLWIDIMWPRNPWIHLRKLGTIASGPLLSQPALIARRGRKRAEEIRELGESLQGKIVKDPRFCYLMEPWEASGTVESVLFVVRNPLESARSMSRQTKLPLPLTMIGWRDAVEKFWKKPPAVPVHIVDFNAFFDPEQREDEVRTLFDFLGKEFDPKQSDQVLSKVLDKGLTTQKSDKPLPKKNQRLYDELLERKAQN